MKAYWHSLRQGRTAASPVESAAARQSTPHPATYLAQLQPEVLASLSPHQQADFERVIALAIPKPVPKLVDLRFTIDLLISRYFIVLMVGKDRRRTQRDVPVSRLTHWGNWVVAVALLLGFNLALTTSVVILGYLIKSALGINLFPGHFWDFVN
ncbi:MAG: hypothetical protein WBA99_12215 [Nodosilinea sp.]